MSLLERQLLFSRLLGKLLRYADDAGIAVTMGECYRTPQQAAWNAAHGLGIARSLHTERLAIDLQCFRLFSGKWTWLSLGSEPEYRMLGNYWKALHDDCAWGGDFKNAKGDPKPDPGHFSVSYDGRK